MQLINTEYYYSNRRLKKPDKLIMVLKDKNGKKVRKTINETKIKYYVTKEEYESEFTSGKPPKYVDANNVRPVIAPYANIYESIVEELDDPSVKSMYRSILNSGERDIGRRLSEIHLNFRLHGSDMNIEDYYIDKYLRKQPFLNNSFGITKCFFDIEVDSSQHKGFPDADGARCPVNAISFIDPNTKIVREYLLNYEGMESFDIFMENIDEFKKDIEKKYNYEYKVEIYNFEEEIELISAFFEDLNLIRPDFMSAWNADYDIPYLINRCVMLDYQPEEICCPAELPRDEKRAYYRLDSNKKELSDKHSTYNISGYTNYIDEMALYANVTKPMGKEESYSLDYIGEKITGMNKEEVVDNMKTFHIVDYTKFVAYSIHDSIMLSKIEEKTNHIDLVYGVSMITHTKMVNAMKKTVCLKNMIRYYAMDRGLVASNNRAKMYDRPTHKIPGAFVAPINIDNVGVEIVGVKSNYIFDCATDLDLTALYPSIIRAFNISSDTYIGIVNLSHNGYKGDNFIQDYISQDIINFGGRYFNLPNVEDLEEDIYGIEFLEDMKEGNIA